MNVRRTLLIAAAALALVVGGLVVAIVLIPEERVADAVARRAEAMLGHPVAIERVGISLFPLPGVRLTDVSVGRPDSTALARVDRAELRVRILPLFGGRVMIRQLDLEHPRIAVAIDDSGRTNIPVLEPDSGPPSTRDIEFAVDRVRVTDGSIRYQNAADSTRVRLDGWNQELRLAGAVEQGELTTLDLTGWVGFDDVTARLPGAVLPARDLELRVDHDATLDLAADRLDLRALEVAFDGVTLEGSGEVTGVNSGRPAIRLELAAEGLDAGRLMAWVPDSLRARWQGDRSRGHGLPPGHRRWRDRAGRLPRRGWGAAPGERVRHGRAGRPDAERGRASGLRPGQRRRPGRWHRPG